MVRETGSSSSEKACRYWRSEAGRVYVDVRQSRKTGRRPSHWRLKSIVFGRRRLRRLSKIVGTMYARIHIDFPKWLTWSCRRPRRIPNSRKLWPQAFKWLTTFVLQITTSVRSEMSNIYGIVRQQPAETSFLTVIRTSVSMPNFKRGLQILFFMKCEILLLNEYGRKKLFFWNLTTNTLVKRLGGFHRPWPTMVVRHHFRLTKWLFAVP